MDRPDRRRLHPRRSSSARVLFILAEARAKEPIVPLDLWKEPDLLGVHGLDLLRGVRVLRRDRLPAALVPGRRELLADQLRPGGPAAHGRPHRQLDRAPASSFRGPAGTSGCSSAAIALMGFATLLMTQLTKDTPVPIVWLWMFIAGLGVGPTFSVFTIVIQNAVPFRQLGVATSNLTFFRQIGGTIALAFVGHDLRDDVPGAADPVAGRRGVPQPVVDGFTQASSGGGLRLQSADRRRRPRRDHPRPDPGAVPGSSRAVRPEHRRRHPRGVQPRHRPDLLARRLRLRRGGHRGRGDQGDPAAGHERDAGPGRCIRRRAHAPRRSTD